MRSLPVALLMLATSIASTTAYAGRVTVEVLRPAQINVADHVQRVAVIDRSAARNAGQAVLGTLEGAVTGEGIRGDRRAAENAVQAMIAQLDASPRFDVVYLNASKKERRSSLWDKGLQASQVRALCDGRCDGIVALEAFDSDSSSDSYTVGARTAAAVASWRFYDARSGAAIDTVRDHRVRYGASTSPGVVDMMLGNNLVEDIGELAALEYAARIAPTWQLEKRRIRGGNALLKQGRRQAQAGDWEGAVATWQQVADGASSDRIRGKAKYNLAVAFEAQGQFDEAIHASSEAMALLGGGSSQRLATRMQMRAADAERLEVQLASR